MIDFRCHCGHPLSVPLELAGSVLQCPQCHRLCDVPLLSELQNIDEDGAYKLDKSPNLKNDPDRIEELTAVFTRDHHDADGVPIDLRQTMGEQEAITPPTIDPGAPKYDPVTGELIRPLDIKTETAVNPKTLPTARRASPRLHKFDIDAPSPLEVFAIPLRLLRPVNLMVMFFILLAQAMCQFMIVVIAAGYWLLAPFWILFHCLFLSHFANVIDETGPTNRNELPTPLRHLGWHDDTFGPFTRFLSALAICYGPAAALLFYAPVKNMLPIVLALSAVLIVLGTLLFPATLLTTVTSGSIVNLRPDRLVGVALTCGPEYAIAVITWIFGGALWLAGTLATNLIGASALTQLTLPPQINMFSSYAVLIVGIFAMHFFSWHLGTLYRRHHERFPWMYQRHHHDVNMPAPARGFEVTQKRPPRRAQV
jgi:hypothetical protein